MERLKSIKVMGLVMVLLTMFNLQALALNSKYYSKATATAVGEGKVYVSYKNKEASPSYDTSYSAESGADSQSSAPTHKYYLYAQANDGYKFDGWYTNEDCTGEKQTENPYELTVTAESTNSSSPTTSTWYAKFVLASTPTLDYTETKVYVNIDNFTYKNESIEADNLTSAIAYASANENVVTVAADGTLAPVANGTTTITASADGVEASYEVTIIDNVAAGKTQIGNGDFEDWSNVTSSNHAPNNWNSFETGEGTLISFARAQKVQMSTDHRPGSNGLYSVDIYSNSPIRGVVAQGNLTLGCINAGDMTADKSANHNFSKITDPAKSETISKIPTAVKVWVKFVPAGNVADYPYARVAATVHDAHNYITHGAAKNDTEDNKAYALAHAELNFEACDWTELTLPFTLTNNAVEDGQLYIVFNASTNAYPGKGTLGDHLYIDDIELIYEQDYDKVPVQISDAKVGTFVAPFDVKMPAAITASTVDDVMADGATLSLTEVENGTVPANTPVILQSDAAQNRVAYGVAAPATAKAGLLTGVYENTVAPAGSYVLQNQNGVVGFYEVLAGQTLNVGANRCYLEAPVAGAKGFFFNADDATAIQSVGQSASQNAEGIYNLAGQRVQKMQKGINIVNGKKVLY